jgi:hypothetical protein
MIPRKPGHKMPDVGSRVNHRATHASEPIEASIGAVMKDGTIYAGISPDTGKAMYAMPADAPLIMSFNEAGEHAKTINIQKAYGHDDWRVPTKNELNVVFNNRAAIGAFNVSGSFRAGWYWSSSPDYYDSFGPAQRFNDGQQSYLFYKASPLSVRLVRSEAPRNL